jgi:hypothetical protein
MGWAGIALARFRTASLGRSCMRVTYCEPYLRAVLSRIEVVGAERDDDKRVWVEGEDGEGRKFLFVHTANDVYINFQKAQDHNLYNTIIMGDKARRCLLDTGRAYAKVRSLEISVLLEEQVKS